MIGWNRVVLNAIVGEARRRRIVFNIVFAAFFNAKDTASCQASASFQESDYRCTASAESASQYAGITDPGYSLCKRANARVNHSTENSSNSHQSNVALQKSD
jgi:hypothetical protein